MATTKRRINISLPGEMDRTLGRLAKRDNMPEATKAIELIHFPLEIEEDCYFENMVERRMKSKVKWLPDSEKIWK